MIEVAAITLGLILFCSLIGMFVTGIKYYSYKSEFYQYIAFMNSVLTSENLTTYKIDRKFYQSYFFNNYGDPPIYKKLMENGDYKYIIEKYTNKISLMKKIFRYSGISMVISILLMFLMIKIFD